MSRWWRKAAVALAASSMLPVTGCTRLVVRQDAGGEWVVHETEHFTLHSRPGTDPAVIPRVADEMEAGYADLRARLSVSFGEVVNYYLYRPDEAAQIDVTAGGFANLDFLTIRQTFDVDAYRRGGRLSLHELAHVVAGRTLGRSGTRLLGEGLAVALDGSYGGRTLEAWRSEMFESGAVLPVDELLRDTSDRPEATLYPQSGSLVLYLVDRFGMEPVKKVYTVRGEGFRSAFAAAFGLDLGVVFAEYIAARGVVPLP